MRSQSTHLRLAGAGHISRGDNRRPCHFLTSYTPANGPCVQNLCNCRRCELVRNLMCLCSCSVSPPPCPPATSKKSLGGRVADPMGHWWRGWVAFKGYPLLGRAKPLRLEDKLKSIVAILHCHLSPALGDLKKQAMRAELRGNCHNMSTWKCALVWWALGIKDQEALIARCPNFSRGFHTDRGQAWHGRMPKLWGAYSGRGVGAPWSMGMGQHLGRQSLDNLLRITTVHLQDRTGQAGQASECTSGQGCVEEPELASKLKSKPCKDRYTSRLPTTPPPLAMAVVALVFGTVITVQLGSEASGPLGVAMRATPDGVGSVQHPYSLDPLLRNTVPASSSP